MREAGGSSRVLGIDDQSAATPRRIGDAVVDGTDRRRPRHQRHRRPARGRRASRACAGAGRVKVGAFDLGPEVLAGGAGPGKLLFAVDQQPYLQGYLPVVMLANRARYGLLPSQGDVVATGANFVTRGERRPGDRAQPPLDPLSARWIEPSVELVVAASPPQRPRECPGWDSNPHARCEQSRV